MSTTAIYLTLIFTSFVREQAQRRQIRSAFGQYLSPALVEQLAQSPEKLVLGGEEREMTIMFSDMRGFTSISETYKNDPQGLTALMNRFLTPLTNAILDRKGTIDKYMGDAIMAFWNAPLDDKDHRAQCLRGGARHAGARRRAQSGARAGGKGGAAARSFRSMSASASIPALCVVGNMGSDQRFDYSVFGDSVNLASRLEGQSQGIRLPDHRRLQDRARGQGQVRDPRTRLHHGEGQEGAGGDLRHRRPRGHRAVRPLPAPAQPDHRDARPAIAAATGTARWRPSRAAARPTRRIRWSCSTISTKSRIRGYLENPPPQDWNGAFALLTK